jgi:hypothetical protein
MKMQNAGRLIKAIFFKPEISAAFKLISVFITPFCF